MIETEIPILINRKSDIDLIKDIIIEQKIQFPIYLFEYESHYKLTFSSDYEEWELDTAILESLPNYEFTSELEKGRKEIRLQIIRFQSEFSTDGWGRPIENPLNETKYLIRKNEKKSKNFNPIIKVLFEKEEKKYYINIANGIDKKNNKKGFLICNEFNTDQIDDKTDYFKDQLYSTRLEAFQNAYYKIQDIVNKDFILYKKNKRKEIQKIQKIPRKIIRDFIKACNNNDVNSILKNLDDEITFEKNFNRRNELLIKGKNEFKKFIQSSNQDFCGRKMKIKSEWRFSELYVQIQVYFFPKNNDEQIKTNTLQIRYFKFQIYENTIKKIIEEN